MSRAHDLERDQRSKLRKLRKRDKRAYYLMGAYGYGPDDFAYKFAWVWRTLLPPIGYRWRGKHVVPVDKHGAMVRAKGTPTGGSSLLSVLPEAELAAIAAGEVSLPNLVKKR